MILNKLYYSEYKIKVHVYVVAVNASIQGTDVWNIVFRINSV